MTMIFIISIIIIIVVILLSVLTINNGYRFQHTIDPEPKNDEEDSYKDENNPNTTLLNEKKDK